MTQNRAVHFVLLFPLLVLASCSPTENVGPRNIGTGGGAGNTPNGSGGSAAGTGGSGGQISAGTGGQISGGTGGQISGGTGGEIISGTGGGSGGITAGTGGIGTGGANSGGTGGTSSDAGGIDASVIDSASETAPRVDSGVADPGTEGDGRFAISNPAATPESQGRLPGVRTGTMQTIPIPAAMGIAGRSVQVYTPAGYVPNTPVAFMVCHDGTRMDGGVAVTAIQDNLAFQKKMPMVVTIFIPAGSRSPEYDTVNATYTNWITTQVLPMVAARNIKLTNDPEASATCGHSSGGILSFTMAWFQPERYRRVLSLSGSYVNLQNPGGGLYDNLIRTTRPIKPIRTAMTVGTNDLARWPEANDTLSAALMAAGYHHRYFVINGGNHSVSSSRTSMPDLLTWLWRGYPATGPTF